MHERAHSLIGVNWRPAAALALMAPILAWGQALEPRGALDQYLAQQRSERPACSDSVFTVRIDASLPAGSK